MIRPDPFVMSHSAIACYIYPENAFVSGVIYNVADQPFPIAKACSIPRAGIIDYVDTVPYAAIFGVFKINYIPNLIEIEFSFWGHIVDYLGTPRAVDAVAGV